MNIHSILKTVERAFSTAGLNPKLNSLKTVTSTIEKALHAAGVTSRLKERTIPPFFRPAKPAPDFKTRSFFPAEEKDLASSDLGQFLSCSYSVQSHRTYKLYVPSRYAGSPMPLIVMLHGCKQNPDDFALGTRLNQLAEREGFLVAYPAQTVRDNGVNCWNWFEPAQQTREGTEPRFIAGVVQDIANAYAIDESQIFVAGLSAGAAMALILGQAYPDIFAGVAAHSGLAVGSAHDVASAFSAMQGRTLTPSKPVLSQVAVPTLVIQGDADNTVAPANANAIVEQALLAYTRCATTLEKLVQPALEFDSKKWGFTRYVDAKGRSCVEQWTVHGGGHTWFGGCSSGSYTDPTGPDASAEIVRFFLGLKA